MDIPKKENNPIRLRARVAELEAELFTYQTSLREANVNRMGMIDLAIKLQARINELERGEFVCLKCGLRKDSDHPKADF